MNGKEKKNRKIKKYCDKLYGLVINLKKDGMWMGHEMVKCLFIFSTLPVVYYFNDKCLNYLRTLPSEM